MISFALACSSGLPFLATCSEYFLAAYGPVGSQGRTDKESNHLVSCSPSDELVGELGFVPSFLDLGLKVSFLSKLKQRVLTDLLVCSFVVVEKAHRDED